MADISLLKTDYLNNSDEEMEQGDGPSKSQIEDESLPPLNRVQKYAQSVCMGDRQMVWRILMDVFRSSPVDTLTYYLPLIMNVVAKLADERETVVRVRIDFIEQIPNLAVFAVNCSTRVPALQTIVASYLLPMVVKNLGTEDGLVRKTAQSALFTLMEYELVSKQEAEEQVCPVILNMSVEGKLVDYHNEAIRIMSKMASLLGREVTERVFLKRFSELCMNDTFYVRKICASHFGDFCSVVGKEAYEQVLLPRYIRLCSDDVWGVRKACAEVAMSVSCACPPTARKYVLAPVFAKLLQDTSRWVRMSAFQTLGPFISTFADPSNTNLFHNSQGELVMVNKDGREFRVKSSASFSVSRSIFPIEAVKEEEYWSFLTGAKEENEDVEINMRDFLGDFEDKGGGTTTEEEGSIQSSNASEKSLTTDIPKNDEASNDVSSYETNKEDSAEDIKEIVETVKNALLSFRNAETNPEPADDADEPYVIVNIQQQTNSCDKATTSLLDDVNREFRNIDLKSIETAAASASLEEEKEDSGNCDTNDKERSIKCVDNDKNNLDLYNSHNYWYVSPEMPVDLSIVEEETEVLPTVNLNVVEEETKMSPSAQINSNLTFVLDDTSFSIAAINDTTYYITGKEEEETQGDNQQLVPQLLIDHYVSMTDLSLAQNTDNEMAYHCAYALPSVAMTLGGKNWHLIKDTVETLASNMQYKVRRTVASSLHELALILGPEIATSDLTPIFDGFLKDLDEVKIGILKHLAEFLRLISPSKRIVYLPRLADFLQTDHELNWRFREELAEQLLLAVPLFRPIDASKYIATIAQELLCDKVNAVCQSALTLITELLCHISNEQGLTTRLLIMLAERFAHSTKWKRRQIFALLCSKLLAKNTPPDEQFATEVMPHLLDLSWDPVANVRLVVGRTIGEDIITRPYFADPNNPHHGNLQTAIRRLQSDRDRDVRNATVIGTSTSNNPAH